jgi:hypothetical protein
MSDGGIPTLTDDLIIQHHHGPNRHFALRARLRSKPQGVAHEIRVGVGVAYSHSIVAGGFPEMS